MTHIITLTGDIAGGKSKVANFIADYLGWKVHNIGTFQRELAEKMKMDTNEFNQHMKMHPEIDNIIDGKIKSLAYEQNIIVDSRLAWHWIPNSLKVYLKVDIDVAAVRVFNDKRITETYSSVSVTKLKIIERRKIEVVRLANEYGVDFSNLNNYDMVIDTTEKGIEEVAQLIISRLTEENQQ
jgi:cytidylate kinase